MRDPNKVKGNFSGGHLLEWLLVGIKERKVIPSKAVPVSDPKNEGTQKGYLVRETRTENPTEYSVLVLETDTFCC